MTHWFDASEGSPYVSRILDTYVGPPPSSWTPEDWDGCLVIPTARLTSQETGYQQGFSGMQGRKGWHPKASLLRRPAPQLSYHQFAVPAAHTTNTTSLSTDSLAVLLGERHEKF